MLRASLLFLVACGGPVRSQWRVEPPEGRIRPLAVAPPLFLADVPGVVQEDVLWDGVYVGNIVFSGGFVTEEREGGIENRSAAIDLDEQERYRAQIADVVNGCVTDALGREGRDWIAAPAVDPTALPAPRRRNLRGTAKEDGRDNQPLPRFELTPQAWSAAPVPDGAAGLLVPVVVHYYGHNGGWFLGQTYGSAGGARVRVLWTVYGPDGAVLGFGDHQAKTEEHGLFSPNRAELQDFLIAVEDRLCRDLRRRLP